MHIHMISHSVDWGPAVGTAHCLLMHIIVYFYIRAIGEHMCFAEADCVIVYSAALLYDVMTAVTAVVLLGAHHYFAQ